MQETTTGRVWDLGVRLFHWLLVLVFAGSWLTAELGVEYREYHFWCGYTALGLVLFRLVWGVVGTAYARFGHFLRGPASIVRYLRARMSGVAPDPIYPGHNPAGGWAVMLLLLLVAIQAVTGLFADDDILYTGPWREAVSSATAGELTDLHHANFDVLLGFVVVHVLAVVLYVMKLREPLLSAMWNGNKPAAAFGDHASLSTTPWLRLIVVAALAAAAVWLMLELAPEPVYDDYY